MRECFQGRNCKEFDDGVVEVDDWVGLRKTQTEEQEAYLVHNDEKVSCNSRTGKGLIRGG